MTELVIAKEDGVVTVTAGAMGAPSSSSDGADISGWRSPAGRKVPMRTMRAVVYLYGTAATLSNVYLWGYRRSRWHRLGLLNGGSDIAIGSSSVGYAEVVGFIGIFDRLAVSATGAVTVTQEFEPMEVVG